MKIIVTIFLFLVSTVILCSCKKHTNPIPLGISVKVNGVLWNPANYVASTYKVTYGSSNIVTFLQIYGYDSLTNGIVRNIILTLQYPIITQSYNLNSSSASAYYRDNLFTVWPDGTINITQISSANVEGTFNLTSDTLTITGEFNVPIK
jgi:hypothetical protein